MNLQRTALLLEANSAELLELSHPPELSPSRAEAFFTRLGELLREDALLSRDYDALKLQIG